MRAWLHIKFLNKLVMKNTLLKLLTCILLLTTFATAKTQVTATFTITPPYSTKLSDYATTMGKMVILLTNTTNATLRVYLKADISGDNGIKISTKPGFRPSQPIILQPGVPFMADIPTLTTLYDYNSLSLKNITSSDIFQKNGLPEGTYTFCVRAYNFDAPAVPLSPDEPGGCTIVRLAQLEPPLLIRPADNETSFNGNIANTPQNITFSWNIPAGSDPGTQQYVFRIVEMLDPGKNPADAMNSKTTPAFYETVTNNNILLYGPADPPLVEGRKYAWSVTALPGVSGASYRNFGRSEVRSFVYKAGMPLVKLDPSMGSKLRVLIPNDSAKVLNVNNDSDLVLTWAFIKNNAFDSSQYATMHILKYQVEIKNAPSRQIIKQIDYNTTIKRPQISVADLASNLTLANALRLKNVITRTVQQCDSIGFVSGASYIATVTAFDSLGNTVQTAASVPFVYQRVADANNATLVTLKGNLRYNIGYAQATYKAANTSLEVTVYKKGSGAQYMTKLPQLTTDVHTDSKGGYKAYISLPSSLYHDSVFFYLNIPNQYYNSNNLPVTKMWMADAPKSAHDSAAITVAEGLATAYGYSLKLYVEKKFPAYKVNSFGIKLTDNGAPNNNDKQWNIDSAGSFIYQTNTKQFDAGIKISLYRKNKQPFMPLVEGMLTEANAQPSGYVEVATGVTQIEKDKSGKDVSFVQFHNLIANDFYPGDEYYIMAKQPDAVVPVGNGNNSLGLQGNINLGALTQDNFTAAEISFDHSATVVYKMPNGQFNSYNNLYDSTVTAKYSVVSKDPPKSLLTGQIVYKWPTDDKHQTRALANQDFSVIVGYKIVDADGTVHYLNDALTSNCAAVTEVFFQSASGLPDIRLLDAGQVMGTGTTDGNGNFTVNVVNLNPKGSLGKGQLMSQPLAGTNQLAKPCPMNQHDAAQAQAKNSNPVDDKKAKMGYEDETWGTNIGDALNKQAAGAADGGNNPFNGALQGGLNNKLIVTPTQGAGNYKLGGALGGNIAAPIAGKAAGVGGRVPGVLAGGDETIMANDGQTLERFYYVVPNNERLKAVDVDIVADAFGVTDCKQLVSYVRDRTINIKATTTSTVSVKGLKVTIFREVQKNNSLPLGEGDNLYTKAPLINPELKNNSVINFNGNLKYGNDAATIYGKTYEKLYTTSINADSSTGAIKQLFDGYSKYFVQVCSDPSTSNVSFGSTIIPIDDYATNLTVQMYPALARIAGRVTEQTGGQPIKNAAIIGGVSNKQTINTLSDTSGYYEQLVGDIFPTSDETKNGISGTYLVSKQGYSFSFRSFQVNNYGGQDVQNVALTPAYTLAGKVISGEKGVSTGVAVYIKRTNGQVIPSAADGSFSINIPSNIIDTLKIIPVDPGYFDTTITVNTAIKNPPQLNQVVFRRKHRIRFIITEPDNYNHVISNAKVYLGDEVHTSNDQGICDFEFENVSINNYSFRIAGPAGIGFIPVVKNVQNEESVTPVVIPVPMQRGSTITGIATLDGQPVKNARVFVNMSNNDVRGVNADALAVTTDKGGNFTITGVPVLIGQTANITATLDTSFTVIGDQQAALINKDGGGLLGKVNLDLKSNKSITIQSVFGFPLSIEKMTTQRDGSVLVTGTIKLANGKSKFSLLPGNDVVRITNTLFVPQVIKGKTFGLPKDNSITLDAVANLKFRYLSKYNVMLSKDVAKPNTLLVLSKNDDGTGSIGGYVNIVDNSFNYPSTYLSFNNQKANFYLSELNNNNSVNTNISAIASFTTDNAIDEKLALPLVSLGQQVNAQAFVNQFLVNNNQFGGAPVTALYHLSDAAGRSVQLRFIEFDGTADSTKSYLASDGKIHLGIGLNCNVPNATPQKFRVDVDDVVLDDSAITPAKGKPLTLAFEKWKLQVDNWTLDPQKGGIFSNTATVKTSKLDIPFKIFNLRKDMMVMDSFNLAGIQLGGGVDSLTDIDPKAAVMIYDTKVGSDQQPHWRFSIAAPEGSNCATIKKLNLLPGAVIGVSYIQLLSNDENIFSLSANNLATPLNNNKLASFTPSGIFNGPDFFDISGTIDVNAPRVAPMMVTLDFTKGASSISNVSTLFEGKGFVNFSTLDKPQGPNIIVNKDSVIISGQVEEKPDKTFETIPAKFIAVNTATPSYTVQLPHNYELDLSAGSQDGYKLVLDKGYMNVVGSDWDVLTFSGKMLSKAPKDSGITDNHMVFTVYGDVQVDGDGLTTTNTTPLGNFVMTYNFKQAILHGSLTIKDVNLGSASVTGTVEMQVDKQGFYVVGAGKGNVQGPLPIGGVYTLGFLMGDHPLDVNSDIWKTATQYMYIKNNCWPAQNGNQLKGFFMAAGKMFLDIDKDFDYVIVSGYVSAHAGVDANIWANFGNGANAGLKATVYVDVSAGLASAFTGTAISGALSVKGTLEAAYVKKALVLAASVDATFSATVTQALPFMDPLSISVTVEAMLNAGTDGFSFKWVKGTLPVVCNY